MDYGQVVRDIQARILDGTISEEDIRLALEVYANARPLWDQHSWLRALGGWQAEVDAFAVRFLRSEMADVETVKAE